MIIKCSTFRVQVTWSHLESFEQSSWRDVLKNCLICYFQVLVPQLHLHIYCGRDFCPAKIRKVRNSKAAVRDTILAKPDVLRKHLKDSSEFALLERTFKVWPHKYCFMQETRILYLNHIICNYIELRNDFTWAYSIFSHSQEQPSLTYYINIHLQRSSPFKTSFRVPWSTQYFVQLHLIWGL